MHVRRAILLFALVLGLTALATSIAPSPRTSPTAPGQAPPPPAAAPPASAAAAVETVKFRAPVSGPPPQRPLRAGQHVIVQVSSADLGQATIPGLGQVAPVDPNTPASFDLLPAAGSYEVIFTPSSGGPAAKAGTLVVKP